MKDTESIKNDIVSLLSAQEEAVAHLYSAFSNALPEMRQFWKNLVAQEKAHAEVLQAIVHSFESSDICLDARRFKAEAIKLNIEMMRKWAGKAAAEGTTPIRALSLAADIEHSLNEMEYFRVIRTEIPSVKKEIEALERHTEQHVVIVEERLNEIRNANEVMEL